MSDRLQLEITEVPSERLDRWLAQQWPHLSRARLQKLIAAGQLRVNGEVCDQKRWQPRLGDRLELEMPPTEAIALAPEEIPLDILYEDVDLLIVNKAVGMVVHPAAGHDTGTLVHALLAHCGDSLTGIGGEQRPGIVHRLDKDTTGAMVVAKTEAALLSLQDQIRQKTAQREYLGVVFGSPRQDSGQVEEPIGRHLRDRKRMAVVPIERGGRWALTHWQVRERLGNYALLHYRLATGRTHQIRVHSHHMGHPLVGDPLYGNGRSLGVNLQGQALHAWRLSLQHPRTGEVIAVEAPLPAEFQRLLRVLRDRSAQS
ncbi:RluA family pseudouridine synthase [Synechococcus elongatus]|uniref:RluA family pseudouridine synthase n=1 Tax=Synechococcus elongatus TaxID=32046 RepID=UPI000F7DD98B|nr:RluA family pseudouridine synthase [Synechococcus elongatus]